VTVIGRVRAQDTNLGPQGAIIGLPTRAANLIDPEAIASELPYPALAGYVELIEQIPGQQSPRPRQAPELSEGPHLAYAVQWFFFALLALVAPAVFLRRSEGA
jgi:cytochrome oxidase assembly protein ShyY1